MPHHRSLSWQTEPPPQSGSPYDRAYPGRYEERGRYEYSQAYSHEFRESSPRAAPRHYSEGYYTQSPLHYPSTRSVARSPPRSTGRSPPPSRGRSPPRRPRTPPLPPRITDVDAWSSTSYTPPSTIRRLSPSQAGYHSNHRHPEYGSRDEPICVDEQPEPPHNWQKPVENDRMRNIGASGAGPLVHEEWRHGGSRQRRTPRHPQNWRDEEPRRPRPENTPDSLASNDWPRRPTSSRNLSWVNPALRSQPSERDEECFAQLHRAVPSSQGRERYMSPLPQRIPTGPARDRQRAVSYDQTLRERGRVERVSRFDEGTWMSGIGGGGKPPSGSYERHTDEMMPERTQTSASSREQPRVPEAPAQRPAEFRPESMSAVSTALANSSDQRTPIPTQGTAIEQPIPQIPPSQHSSLGQENYNSWPQAGAAAHSLATPRSQHLGPPPKVAPPHQTSLWIPQKRPKPPKPFKPRKSLVPQSEFPRESPRESSLDGLTEKEKDQLFSKIGKSAARLLFLTARPAPTSAARSVEPPAGSTLNQIPEMFVFGKEVQSSEMSSEKSLVKDSMAVVHADLNIASVTSASTLRTQELNSELNVQPYVKQRLQVPVLRPIPTITEGAILNAILPEPIKPEAIRKRRRSISSSSSGHSPHSSSPFLSAPLTDGKCQVCDREDQPSVNRLARCAECANLYHQSCHVPGLTKAILEEAGESWKCRKCKEFAAEEDREKLKASATVESQEKGVMEGVITGSEGLVGVGAVKPKGLTIRKKSHDEQILERVISTNRSSHKNFMQMHEDYRRQWKSPKMNQEGFPTSVDEVKDSQTVVNNDKLSESVASIREGSTSEKLRLASTRKVRNAKVAMKRASKNLIPIPPSGQPSSLKVVKLDINTSSRTPSTSQAPTPDAVDFAQDDVTFHEISKEGEAVPSLKPPPTKTIPASQTSDSSQQLSPALTLIEPHSPPIIRPRKRTNFKRELVIHDSEEESANLPKRPKVTKQSPRAAMKTASKFNPSKKFGTSEGNSRLPSSTKEMNEVLRKLSTPGKFSPKHLVPPGKSKDAAKKLSSRVAKKSAVNKSRSSETPDPTLSKPRRGKPTQLTIPPSPLSPALTSTIRQRQTQSPIPSTRPESPGASQHYSLHLIMASANTKNTIHLTTPTEASFPLFSSLYPPMTSIRAPPRPVNANDFASGLRKRSQKRDDFDILSLVPEAAVAVLEDGKLAFREGAVDLRTGQLKRGARKFKVGKVATNGDII